MKSKSGNSNTMNLNQKKKKEPLSKIAVLYRKGNILIYNRKDGPPKEK